MSDAGRTSFRTFVYRVQDGSRGAFRTATAQPSWTARATAVALLAAVTALALLILVPLVLVFLIVFAVAAVMHGLRVLLTGLTGGGGSGGSPDEGRRNVRVVARQSDSV